MTTTRSTAGWREALAAFEAWAAADKGAREAMLATLAATDPELHRRTEALIAADRDAIEGGFLDGGARLAWEPGMTARAGAEAPLHDGAARRPLLGPWALERRIGRGGMGEVWLARRHDGLYQGEAAIKMLRESAAGEAVAEAAGARFAREGELLARLAHPGIARLLDAGIDADGQRYLVLEYVDGERIDRWCDARQLGPEARIGLVLQVCAAVAHAHANLVVHRDLKPSNILVDADGRPRLLDFGVAKLVDEGGGASELTRLAGTALTPEYAAPEQIAGEDVTTATDVYALGLVAYRLLAGAGPHGPDDAAPLSRARAVVDAPPTLLARRARGMDVAQAALRASTPGALAERYEGDLETVLDKALRREPRERYATAQAFADDLARWLRSEPVTARAASPAHRARLFTQRHRVPVALATLALLAVLGGLAGSLWQAREARLQAAAARSQAARADAVKDFLLGLFEANSVENGGARAPDTTARELLDLGRRKIERGLADQPEVRSEVLATLSDMYYQIGRKADSEALDAARVAQLRAMGQDGSLAMVDALYNHAQTLRDVGRSADALARVGEASAMLQRIPGDHAELQARLLETEGDILRATDLPQALLRFEQARDILLARHPESKNLAGTVGNLASTLQLLGRFDDARRTMAEAMPVILAHHGPQTAIAQAAMVREADGLLRSNHLGEALDAYARLYPLRLASTGRTHEETLYVESQLAALRAQKGERDEALRLVDEVIAGTDPDPAHSLAQVWGRGHFVKGQVLLGAGDLAGARRELDVVDARFARELPKAGLYARYLLSRAELADAEGAPRDAQAIARHAQAILAAIPAPCYAGGWAADAALARYLQHDARFDDAAPLVAAVAACRTAALDETPIRVVALLGLGAQALAGSDAEAAMTDARDASALIAASADRTFYAHEEAEAERLQGRALEAAGRRSDALAHYLRAAEVLEARELAGSPRLMAARADARRVAH